MVVNLDRDVSVSLLDQALLRDQLNDGVPRRVHSSAIVHGTGNLHVGVDPRHTVRVHHSSCQFHVLQVFCRQHRHLQLPLRTHRNRTPLSLSFLRQQSLASTKPTSYKSDEFKSASKATTPIQNNNNNNFCPKSATILFQTDRQIELSECAQIK